MAREQVDAERERADADDRAKRLEAEVVKCVEAERERAEAKERADAEKQQAAVERERAERLQAELRELQEKYKV